MDDDEVVDAFDLPMTKHLRTPAEDTLPARDGGRLRRRWLAGPLEAPQLDESEFAGASPRNRKACRKLQLHRSAAGLFPQLEELGEDVGEREHVGHPEQRSECQQPAPRSRDAVVQSARVLGPG